MKLNKKFLIAGLVAALISGSAVDLTRNTAEAGFDLGGALKDIGKDAVKKSLNIDVEGMQDRKQQMVLNLSRAAICYAEAAIDVSEALNLNPEQRAQMQAALTGLKNNKTDLGSMKLVGETTKLSKEELETATRNLMDSGDQAKIEQANELIKKSKTARSAAGLYQGLATRDITMLISNSVKAMAGGDLGDKLKSIQEISEVANAAKAVNSIINDNRKIMKEALKAYEKKNNIKDVSEKDAKKQMEDAGLE